MRGRRSIALSLVRLVATRGRGVTLGALLFGSALLLESDEVAAHLGEEDARVEDGEEGRADENEGRVEDEEADLVLHDVVAPTTGHFSNTIKKKACQYM